MGSPDKESCGVPIARKPIWLAWKVISCPEFHLSRLVSCLGLLGFMRLENREVNAIDHIQVSFFSTVFRACRIVVESVFIAN